MNPAMRGGGKLPRVLGRWTLTALVINCTIASGIFILPANIAAYIGSAAPWAYLIAAVGIATIMIAFAELASQVKDAGGPYVYAREAFGPLAGIQTAWFAWLTRIASAAAIANAFVRYLGEFFPDVTEHGPRVILLTLTIGGLALVNVRGLRQGALISNVFTAAKLVPLALFVVVGFVLAPHVTPATPLSGPTAGAWVDALVFLLFAFGGFEGAFLPAGEAKNPRQDAPFAVLTGLTVITVIYVSVHLVAMWSLPDLAQSRVPLADAARVFIGQPGAKVIAIGAALSTLGGLCAGVVTAPRLLYALGQRGDFPRVFAWVHPRFQTPYVAIVVWAVLVLGLAVWGSFAWNAMLSAVARLMTYAIACAALIRLRRRRPMADAWRAPAGNLMAVLGIGFCGLLATSITGQHLMILLSVATIGLANWLTVRSRSPVATAATTA